MLPEGNIYSTKPVTYCYNLIVDYLIKFAVYYSVREIVCFT